MTDPRRSPGHEAEVAWVEALLLHHDPVGISSSDQPDEYRPEAETIVGRRREAQSRDMLRRVIHGEFAQWFDPETAGSEARYALIADELWRSWGTDTSEG